MENSAACVDVDVKQEGNTLITNPTSKYLSHFPDVTQLIETVAKAYFFRLALVEQCKFWLNVQHYYRKEFLISK
jgi:hypothetical protein